MNDTHHSFTANVVPQVSQQPDGLAADGSALVRMKVEGGVPADEDLVEWRLTHESFTLKPGMKNGLYEALTKSVRNCVISV